MVATFHLHYLGHRIKYGNLEVGNTTQQLLSTTRPCCSIEFIESILFRVILVTYYIGIYICIYIFIKLAIFILFLLSSVVMFFLHCMLNILGYEKYYVKLMSYCFIAWSIKLCNIFGCSWSVFFSQENCVSFGLLFCCFLVSLLLNQQA